MTSAASSAEASASMAATPDAIAFGSEPDMSDSRRAAQGGDVVLAAAESLGRLAKPIQGRAQAVDRVTGAAPGNEVAIERRASGARRAR